ncbi:MAG: hypothetical protein IKS41_03150 [Alphaproteobacteria bacterium]|nr:hypothetical protein [Alphaproteobacteria bacterium]
MMKKYICVALLGLLAGCMDKSEFMKEKSDMQSCLTAKAMAYVQDGTALASPMRTTVKKMLAACLAPEEQTPATTQLAQGILSALMNQNTAQ